MPLWVTPRLFELTGFSALFDFIIFQVSPRVLDFLTFYFFAQQKFFLGFGVGGGERVFLEFVLD